MQSIYELNRFNFSADQDVTLPEHIKRSASAAVKKWQRQDPLAATTKLVSLDCVVDRTGQLQIISFDRIPKGLELLRSRQGDRLPVVSGHRNLAPAGRSYHGFSGRIDGGGTFFPDHPAAIIAEFESRLDEEISYQDRSFPHNGYGEDWLWRRVNFGNHDELIDYDAGFSLKAINQRRVYICPPAGRTEKMRKAGIKNVRTVSQMIRKLDEYMVMYYQPFVEPMLSTSGRPMIYSLYYQYDSSKGYTFVGGLSISRKSLNIVLEGEDIILGVID